MAIGSLVVNFEARTGKFETDTGRAAKMMEKRAKEIDAQARKIGQAFGVAAGAAIVGLGALVKKSIDAADEMSKLAQKTGVSIEALSQLNYAASLSGIDGLGDSLAKFNRSIAEAAQGTKAQEGAFKALGIEIKDAAGNLKSTETLFEEVAEALSKIPDGADKVAVAMDLFGKSGAELIPLLNSGKKGIQEMREEADKLGLTLDERTGKAAEAFNDNMSKMGFAATGIANRLASQLAPELERLTGLLVDVAKDGDAVKKSADGIAAAFKGVILVGATLGNVIQGLSRVFVQGHLAQIEFLKGNFSRAYDELAIGSAGIMEDVKDVTRAYDTLFGDVTAGTDAVVEVTDKATNSTFKYADALGKAEKKAKDAKKAGDEWAASLESAAAIAAEAERLLGPLQARADALTQGARSPLDQYRDDIAELERFRSLGLIDDTTFARQSLMVEESFIRMTEVVEKAGDASKTTFMTMEQFGEAAAQNMQDALGDFFLSFGQGTKGMVRQFAQAMAQIAAQQLALRTFSFFSSFGSGGLLDGLLGLGGGLGGNTPISPSPRASGGPVMAGMPYLVGERGPELMVPKTAGAIVPNNALGGGPVNLRVVNAFDQNVMAEYMTSSAGEEVFLNLARRNAAKIRNFTANG